MYSVHAPPVPETWLDMKAPPIADSPVVWLIFGVFALTGIIAAFMEGGPGWLVLKWLARIALCALMVPLAFLAWYMAAAIPVSVAILLGAGIIAVAIRASAGRVRRLMAPPQAEPRPRHAYRIDPGLTDAE